VSKKICCPVISAAVAAGLILFFLACQLTAMNYPSGELIFKDDFSSSENLWDIWNRPNESAVSYLDGSLIMIVNQPNTDIVSANNQATHHCVQ